MTIKTKTISQKISAAKETLKTAIEAIRLELGADLDPSLRMSLEITLIYVIRRSVGVNK